MKYKTSHALRSYQDIAWQPPCCMYGISNSTKATLCFIDNNGQKSLTTYEVSVINVLDSILSSMF